MNGTRTVFFEDRGHPGRDGIAFLHRLLMIDEEWTQWHDDGFTWWGHTFAQRYRWVGPIDVDGIPTWFFSIDTDFVRHATDGDAASAFVNAVNADLAFGAGAAVIEGDRIRFRARTYATEESVEDRMRFLTGWGIIVAATTHAVASEASNDRAFLERLGWQPTWAFDTSAHPTSGERLDPDDMLSVVAHVFAPLGRSPALTHVVGGLDWIGEGLSDIGFDVDGGDDEGVLIAEGSVDGDLVRLHMDAAAEHPILGYGFRVRLDVTPHARAVEAARWLDIAQQLNRREDEDAVPLIGGGAWSANPDRGTLTFTSFQPNAGLRRGWAALMAGNAALRIEVARRTGSPG